MVEITLVMANKRLSRLPALESRAWSVPQLQGRAYELYSVVKQQLFTNDAMKYLYPPEFAQGLGYRSLRVSPSQPYLAWERRPYPGSFEHIRLSLEEQRTSFEAAVAVLKRLGVEYWPTQGTLVALMRYGAMMGRLSKGKVDVVDHDMDFMVRVEHLEHWFNLATSVTSSMLERGWEWCELELGLFPLVCIIVEPFYHRVEFGPYVKEGPNIHLSPAGSFVRASEPKYTPPSLDGLPDSGLERLLGRQLSAQLVYPLRYCRGYDESVMCPHDGVQLLRELYALESWADNCFAVPVFTSKRNMKDARNVHLSTEGLEKIDLAILSKRATELACGGWVSFRGELRQCNFTRTRRISYKGIPVYGG